jgi:hypothetical protein
MITLPAWTLLLVGALIALAMYFLGSLHGEAKGRIEGYEDGSLWGYRQGYRDCLERPRPAEQIAESEVGDAQ